MNAKNTSRCPCKPISQKNTMAPSSALTPKRMRFGVVFACMLLVLARPAFAGRGTVYLIHTGDIHGHLVPRSNVRSDATGRTEGGLARMYTVIQQIRAKARREAKSMALLINTGDTLQGSGEALFTRGQAMIDVLNLFKFDAHAPGNWDFLYGTKRFEEVFKGDGTNPPLAPWNALASNLYDTNRFDDTAMCAPTGTDPNGKTRKLKRVLPPYAIKQVGDVKVGILGFTTARAITAIGPKVTAGYRFSEGDRELPCLIKYLRQKEQVDLLVMISELEMARTLKLVEANTGVDVVLSADMHEETIRPIVVAHPGGGNTIVVEEGQDGTMIGEIRLKVANQKVAAWQWTPHLISDDIPEDQKVAARIKEVRKPFVKETFVPGQTVTIAGNTTTLLHPLDEVIAQSEVDLHRSNFLDEDLPAVVEGSSHDLIADAMRWAAGSDVAAIRGFRYGTHIRAGQAITMADIYHFVPIAAKLGRASNVCGADLKKQLENVTAGVFHPDPARWQGGWVFGYSGATFDLDACGGFGLSGMPLARISNLKVNGALVNTADAYDSTRKRCKSGAKGYRIAGYWYADDPATINHCATCRGRPIQVVTKDQKVVDLAAASLPDSSSLLDVTEAVVQYLREGLGGKVTADNLMLHRINIKRLPSINPYPFKVIQPLDGATAKTCPLARPADDQEQF